jgi:site-specific DNA-methyltransferase (adenine-specific)
MISEALNMDCMDFMRDKPDKFFELAICDIPYGLDVGNMAFLQEMKTTVKQKNGNRLNGNKAKKPYAKKDWDNKIPDQQYFNELKRVTKHQIIFGIEYTKWVGVGAGRIKWDKGVAEGMSFNRYEIAYCSLMDNEVTIPLLWAGMCQAANLTNPMVQQGNKQLNEKRIHPCHKPILLYKRLLIDYAKKGDKILDTHLGSGSSRIACYDGGFDFVGCELDKDYFEAMEKRFQSHIKQLTFELI